MHSDFGDAPALVNSPAALKAALRLACGFEDHRSKLLNQAEPINPFGYLGGRNPDCY